MPTDYKRPRGHSFDVKKFVDKEVHEAILEGPPEGERINLRIKHRMQLRVHALQQGKTLTDYINEAIREKVEQDMMRPPIPGTKAIVVSVDLPHGAGRPLRGDHSANPLFSRAKVSLERLTLSEKCVARKWQEAGYFVLKNGAPDFLMLKLADNSVYRFVAVEVKNRRTPHLTASQQLYKKALELAGVEYRLEIIGDEDIEKEKRRPKDED